MSPNDVANDEVLATLALVILVGSAAGCLFVRWRSRLRRRGHQSPFVSVSLVLAYVATLGVGLVGATWVSDYCWSCSPAASPGQFQADLARARVVLFAIGLTSATALGVASTAAAVWLTPRGARRGGRGQARFPWRGCARICLALMCLVVAFTIGRRIPLTTAYRSMVLLLTGWIGCWVKARQAGSPSLDDVLATDARAPVLYLRPFEQEDSVFAYPKNS